MNFKIISTETIADTKFALLKGQISELRTGLNIFTGPKANQTIDDLLEAKEAGINLRELFSKIKGLEFLAFDSKPVVDQTTDERSQLTSAQKSIYTCLDKLSKKNKAKIQEVLARDFEKLGFKTKAYTRKEPGWLGKELRIAAKEGNIIDVQNLLDSGADINAKNNIGWTALKYAAFRGEKGCVDLLLKVGAKIDAKTNDENTALDLAKKNNHIEVVRLLEAAMEDQS